MTKYRLQAVLFVMVAFMLGCNEYMIVGVLPDIKGEFGTPLATLGYLVTVFAGVYALLTPVLTTIASRFRRYDILLVYMAIFLVGNTWTALAGGFWSLLLSRILTASVSGAIISLVLILAAQLAPREKRAGLVSWVFAGFSIASIIGIDQYHLFLARFLLDGDRDRHPGFDRLGAFGATRRHRHQGESLGPV